MKTNRFWIFILLSTIVISTIAALFIHYFQAPSEYALIHKNGALTATVNLSEVYKPYSLSVDNIATVFSEYPTGETQSINILDVEFGRIRVKKADCRDGICIKTGWRSGGIMPIVCLPNRMVITFTGVRSVTDIDAEVG